MIENYFDIMKIIIVIVFLISIPVYLSNFHDSYKKGSDQKYLKKYITFCLSLFFVYPFLFTLDKPDIKNLEGVYQQSFRYCLNTQQSDEDERKVLETCKDYAIKAFYFSTLDNKSEIKVEEK